MWAGSSRTGSPSRLTESRPATIAVVVAILEKWGMFGDEEEYASRHCHMKRPRPPHKLSRGGQCSDSLEPSRRAESREALAQYFTIVKTEDVVSIRNYVQRWLKETFISNSALVISLLYIDRLLVRWPCLPIMTSNLHRLFSTNIMIASKFTEDCRFDVNRLSSVTGFPKNELIDMERVMLKYLKFELFVSEGEFEEAETFFSKEACTKSIAKTIVRRTLRRENVRRYYLL